MNISTGGLHILLFERDQQLASLLMSELQLAGYEGHTARTAVEVFDAIARYPVRLVLVNLAQAAAARREFWVALDTQRRGSNIQVVNFHCTNLAGYGPRDLEEHLASVVDVEIDGMLGIIKLLEVVRARVPNLDVNANTVPRMGRATSSSAAVTARFTQPIPIQNGSAGGRGSVSRNAPSEGTNQHSASRMSAVSLPHTPPSVLPVSSAQPTGPSSISQTHRVPQMPVSPSDGEHSQAVYPDKIRAVIYPSQPRNWSAPIPTNQEVSLSQDATVHTFAASQTPARSASDTSVLQRLADGQLDGSTSVESGLAQLTRMLQESLVPNQELSMHAVSSEDTYVPSMYTPPTTPRVASTSETISSQSLRPAPIHGLPEERPVSANPLSVDGQRRPDVLSHANYHQQSSSQMPPSAAQSPLASLATSGMVTSSTPTMRETVENTDRPVISKDVQKEREDVVTVLRPKDGDQQVERESEVQPVQRYADKSSSEGKWEKHEERQQEEGQGDEDGLAENSVILDILQSFPATPAAGQQQAVQPQVLNGRVSRSLGSVLLDGHLVPQERLEVAQSIQRMLRGVDLNYQLGEILLMFKLLTPDQLLAASLVSYGLITTTQIGAFGRIRQELHSIGLEYDLENLLVLFRVLTPEQLREARSNIQS
jgi:hypothetical protein